MYLTTKQSVIRILDPYLLPAEPELLTAQDESTMAVVAVMVVVLYFYSRRSRKTAYIGDSSYQDIPRDILGQPKQVVKEFEVPFKNFSLDFFHIITALVLLIIFCGFLYLYP